MAERLGEVALIFPAAGQGPAPVGMSDNPEVLDAVAASRLAEAGREEIWAQALARAVAHATTEVVAVLGRVSLSLSDVLALDVGVSLPLPMAALQMVQLEGVGGTLLCRGQIGQGNGRRALRLYAGVDADEPLYALPATVSEVVPAAAQPLERTVPRGQGARRDLSGAADPILPAGVDMPEAQDGRGGEVPADARASLARTSMAG